MREFGRRAALVVVATVAAVGLSAVTAPSAQALDTGWPCPGCRVVAR